MQANAITLLREWYFHFHRLADNKLLKNPPVMKTKEAVREIYVRDFDWLNVKGFAKQKAALKELETEIDAILAGKPYEAGAFAKLSTRSPKDNVFHHSKLFDRLDEVDHSDATMDPIAFYRCACRAMRVESGFEIIQQMVMSERVYVDLQMALLKQQEEFKIQLYLRSWETFDPGWEFRLIVAGGERTALTQYHKSFNPEIAKHKDLAAKLICEAHDAINPKLVASEFTDYAIDFFLLTDEKGTPLSARLIEINHSPPIAGTALFKWESAQDRQILRAGPFEVRVVEEVDQQPERMMPDHVLIYQRLLRGEEIEDPPLELHGNPEQRQECCIIC